MSIETPGEFLADLAQESQRWGDEWHERTGMPVEDWQGHQGAHLAHIRAAARHQQAWLDVAPKAMRIGHHVFEAVSKVARYGIAAALGALVWHAIH